ncbi:conserved exported hypothetical protein [Thermococcus barophilus]|uniref:DUF2341 domain-containing protein n=1 Tax=Thermococcus barophilus TaxID=55802 RepID=A0A0S1XF43_THEBA|nr:conserved exported hypothetical protein [Thermococcus barophilus]
MKRRGFFLNSVVLLLLIPLLLLLATYEDVSSQVIQAQSVRTQAERTYRVASFLELDFQKALEISGKRAIITIIDYVSVTGDFISPTYMVNNTIRDLILEGTSPSLIGYDPNRVMRGQSLRRWLLNISADLRDQGFNISPSIDEILNSMEITVAPLDSFRVVIKARIPNITIRDVSGRIVYTGAIPSNGGYIYSIVDVQNLEDPIFSAMTGGRYYRSIRACPYSFPELLDKPIKVLEGNGSSTVDHFVEEFSRTVDPDRIYFGDYYPGTGAAAYVLLNNPEQNVTEPIVFNTTLNGRRTSPLEVFNEGDMGVLVFGNVSGAGGTGTATSWCSLLNYRLNLTIQNNVGVNLVDYQIPLLLSTSKGFTSQLLNFIFTNTLNTYGGDPYNTNASIAIYDTNCNPIPFWIEYWDPVSETALIWIRASIPAGGQLKIELYFGNETSPTKGDGDSVFEFFDDFSKSWTNKWVAVSRNQPYSQANGELTINGGNSIFALRTQLALGLYGGFAVRFRMKAEGEYADWDAGIGVEDYDGNVLLFTDDTTNSGDGLAIHRPWWNFESYTIARYPISTYHVYEALLKPYLTYSKDSKFNDVTDSRSNDDWWNRYWVEPLNYLYLVIDSERTWRRATYDFIAIRKYTIDSTLLEDPFNGITFYWSTTSLADLVERKPSSTTTATTTSSARAYDIQPFIDCIMDQRYFGIYNAPSFFERLEGSTINHAAYEALAHQLQDELGVKYGSQYYPIGLVSFMIPDPTYDQKLFDLFNTLRLSIEEGQTSFDYYFLQYYFKGGAKVTGYRMWGVSQGVTSQGDLSSVPFFIDNQTAVAIFGVQGAQDLLQR